MFFSFAKFLCTLSCHILTYGTQSHALRILFSQHHMFYDLLTFLPHTSSFILEDLIPTENVFWCSCISSSNRPNTNYYDFESPCSTLFFLVGTILFILGLISHYILEGNIKVYVMVILRNLEETNKYESLEFSKAVTLNTLL